MAGGLGTKLFLQGDTLSADDVNGYFMNQAVMRFATTAARDAAFGNGIAVSLGGDGKPLLQEGMIAYIDSLDLIQYYNGSSWQDSDQFTVANGSITTEKLAANSVTSDKIAPGTVIAADIAAGSITNTEINASAGIVDTKLATISTDNKVSISALNIDGGTDIGASIADADLIIVDDGGNGTNRKAAATRISDYVFGKVSGDVLIASNGAATIQANSVALGTDTTGNYVASLVAGTGITLTNNSGEGATPTIAVTGSTYQPLDSELTALAGLTSAADKLPYFTGSGTASTTDITSAARSILDDASTGAIRTTLGVGTTDNPTFAGATIDAVQVGITAAGEIDTTTGNLTIDSAGGTVTVDDNLVVSGNLTVNGTTTTINTATLNVSDNIVVLNNDVTGSPTEDAGIEVERGTSTNVLVRWNETNDKWELTNDGTSYGNIITTADSGTVTSTMIANGTIADADINASAGIQLSKLASSTAGNIIVYNSSGVPTAVAGTGDVTIDSSGVASISSGVIVNADISSSAAVEISKIADVTIDTKTANYTLVLTDKNKLIEINMSSSNTVSVPTNANAAFPIGSQIHITQYGSGKTQIAAVTPATTTIRSAPSAGNGAFLRAQYSSATLIKRATDEWYLVGDLSAT